MAGLVEGLMSLYAKLAPWVKTKPSWAEVWESFRRPEPMG